MQSACYTKNESQTEGVRQSDNVQMCLELFGDHPFNDIPQRGKVGNGPRKLLLSRGPGNCRFKNDSYSDVMKENMDNP